MNDDSAGARRRTQSWVRRLQERPPPLLQGHRTLLLGIVAAVGGIAGAIRAVIEGAGIWEILGCLGIGILGVLLASVYVIAYAGRPARRGRR